MKKDKVMMQGREKVGERRASSRFKLKGDAWFQWETVCGQRGDGEGTTRDVGKGGAFLESSNVPPAHSQIKLVVTLRGAVNADMSVCLCGVGWVRHVRSENGIMVGFGVEVPFHTEAPAQTG